MAGLGTLDITLRFESFVKLSCDNNDCQYNLITPDQLTCNLKYLSLSETGKCNDFVSRENDKEVK